MAGRGTDIQLGGLDNQDKNKDRVLRSGGLYIIGTERHESRRIDNQLRGRIRTSRGTQDHLNFFCHLKTI